MSKAGGGLKVYNLILKTLKEFIEIDESTVNESTHFIRDLNLTSYDIVSMIGQLEYDLGIEIPDREIRNYETIGELSEYLKQKIL